MRIKTIRWNRILTVIGIPVLIIVYYRLKGCATIPQFLQGSMFGKVNNPDDLRNLLSLDVVIMGLTSIIWLFKKSFKVKKVERIGVD
jgi:hypothetical protein